MKPMIIRVREAKENILKSVNSAIRGGVPVYVLEPVIAEIHASVSKAAQTEYENAVRDYEAAQKQAAEEKTEAGGEKDERTEK